MFKGSKKQRLGRVNIADIRWNIGNHNGDKTVTENESFVPFSPARLLTARSLVRIQPGEPLPAKPLDLSTKSPKQAKSDGQIEVKNKANVRAVKKTPEREPRSSTAQRLQIALERCVQYHSNLGHTAATLKWYEREIGPFIHYLAASNKSLGFCDITYDQVSSYLGHMRELGRAPDSIRTRLGAIRAFLNQGADGWLGREYRAIDPEEVRMVNKMKLAKVSRQPKPFMAEEDFQAMIDLCPLNELVGARRQAMLYLFASTGIRKNELYKLQVKDILFREKKVLVHYGKHQKFRSLPLMPQAMKALMVYQNHRNDDLPCLWITSNKTGNKPLGYDGLSRDLTRLAEFAGIPPDRRQDICHIHRRTFCAYGETLGFTRAEIMAVTGHSTEAMVAHYIAALKLETGEILDHFQKGYRLFGRNEK